MWKNVQNCTFRLDAVIIHVFQLKHDSIKLNYNSWWKKAKNACQQEWHGQEPFCYCQKMQLLAKLKKYINIL